MNYRKSTMPEGEEYWQLEGKFMNHSFLAVLNKEQRAIMADPEKHSVGHKYSLEELQAGVSHSHNGVPCHQNH